LDRFLRFGRNDSAWDIAAYPVRAFTTALGFSENTFSSARAGPRGFHRPCSYIRSVGQGLPREGQALQVDETKAPEENLWPALANRNCIQHAQMK